MIFLGLAELLGNRIGWQFCSGRYNGGRHALVAPCAGLDGERIVAGECTPAIMTSEAVSAWGRSVLEDRDGRDLTSLRCTIYDIVTVITSHAAVITMTE